ncbi:MAG: SURF1 family protein [Candidatus Thiodiazotropha sp.]
MTSNTRQFRAQAIPTIIMVILTPLFIGLGLWQLDRAEQKRNQGSSLEMRRKQPPVSLNGPHPDAEQLRFRQVVAHGRYLIDKSVLIENRKHQGKTGFHLVTPLRLQGSGRTLLVNRGWIAHDQIDQALAAVDVGETLTVHGEVRIPQPPAIELKQKGAASADTTPRWPFLTLEHFRDWSGLDIAPFVVLQSPQDAHGFVRQWPHPRVSDIMHIGYAIQWFAFAIITLLIWIRLSLHKRDAKEVAV